MTASEVSSPRRRSRLVLFLIALVVLIAVGWAGAWVYAANRVEKELDAWIEREAREGRVWACAERGLGGFPFRLQLNCATPTLDTTSGDKLHITTTSARATAQIWSPNAIRAEFTSPARIQNKETGEVFGAHWDSLTMNGVGDMGGRPQRAALQARGLRVEQIEEEDTDASPLASFAELDLESSLVPANAGGPEDVSYSATIKGGSSPILVLFGEKGPVDLSFTGVVTAAADLKPMPLEQRLRAWAAAKGEARITQFTLSSPSVAVTARGTLSLDPQGQVNGNLNLGFAGVQQLAGQLSAAGIIPEGMAPMVGALAMVGQPADVDGRRGVSFPLAFKDGRLNLSGLPVGRVPPAF
ncbi:DUF2125 domain-containing protein [Xanthobacter sp. TB0136]|uniref:DUF2125 domain-containing protein n=1 Tax=Xanthobacter sp. TB0136 TaxID=3459177 RepID=UPI004039B33C